MHKLAAPLAAVFRTRTSRGGVVFEVPAELNAEVPPTWTSRCGLHATVADDDVMELHPEGQPGVTFRFSLWSTARSAPRFPFALHVDRGGTGVLLVLAPYCHLFLSTDEDARRAASVALNDPRVSLWLKGLRHVQLASFAPEVLERAVDVQTVSGPTAALALLYARRPPFACTSTTREATL